VTQHLGEGVHAQSGTRGAYRMYRQFCGGSSVPSCTVGPGRCRV
jgi:hypothetical protein